MEVHEGNKVIACTKVILNPDEIVKVKRPKRGKKITSNDFDAFRKEKRQEMMKDYKKPNSRRN